MAIDTGQLASKPANQGGSRPWSEINWNLRIGSSAISVAERMLFTERIELLLETGVNLREALQAINEQSEDQRLAAILQDMVKTVEEGRPFSVALARHPEMFPVTYVSLVAAAEDGSFLPQVLAQLREMDEQNSQMRAALVAALAYPAFLVAFSLAVVIFVLVVIFPQFQALFESIRDQLPLPTIVLMWASEGLRQRWLPLVLVTVGALAVAGWWLRTPAGAVFRDRAKMRIPVIRDIFIQTYLRQTLSVLGMSMANGVPITVALQAAQEVVRNSVFARFQKTILANVEQGRGLAVGFAEEPFIPPLVRQMIATGEQTGNLAKIMKRLSEFYARDLNKRLTSFAKAIEPIMLIVMGVVVGLIVAALILPIFKLSRAVH